MDQKTNNLSFDYMNESTGIGQYIPFPLYLLDMDISHTAKILYALLLNRATLSQKNNWSDSEGKVFILYTISSMEKDLKKCRTTIKNALNELEQAGLLSRHREEPGKPTKLYVKVLSEIRKTKQKEMVSFPPPHQPEKYPAPGHKNDRMRGRNPPTNNYIETSDNNNKNKTMKYCSHNRYQKKGNSRYKEPMKAPVIENVESF